MLYNRAFSDPHFSQTHKTLTRGIFILGGVLFFLATFIFIFPAFVATSIAGLLFLAGVFVLTVAWKFWRYHEQVLDFEKTWKNKDVRTQVFYFRGHL